MMILSGGMNVGLCMFSGHLSPVVVDWTATVVVVTVVVSVAGIVGVVVITCDVVVTAEYIKRTFMNMHALRNKKFIVLP